MAEKRKPAFIFLLKKQGKRKTNKVELFERSLFTDEKLPKRCYRKQYRLRVDGKWYPKGGNMYYASWEIKELLWRNLPI